MTDRVTQVVLRAGRVGPDDGVSDAELLDRFHADGDPVAFELLARRYDRLVWAVCRRVSANHHDAEDAFQATLLALARRASSIRASDAVAPWLHRVATRLAVRLRARRLRQPVGMAVEPVAPPTPDPDLKPVIDEAVQALPRAMRDAVVLVYLRGLTYDEAARSLGWPKGTLSVRLTRARSRLRIGLERRGVTVTGAALVAAFADRAGAGPEAKLTGVLDTARLVAAGQAVGSTLPAHIVRLSYEATPLSAIKLAVAGVLVVACVAVGTMSAGSPTPTVAAVPTVAEQVPDVVRLTGRIDDCTDTVTVSRDGRFIATGHRDRQVRVWDIDQRRAVASLPTGNVTPDHLRFIGRELAVHGNVSDIHLWDWDKSADRVLVAAAVLRLRERDDERILDLSADGKRVATLHDGGGCPTLIRVRECATGRELFHLNHAGGGQIVNHLSFAPDGKRVAFSEQARSVVVLDADTGKEVAELRMPKRSLTANLVVWSSDGSRLVSSHGTKNTGGEVRVWQVGRWDQLPTVLPLPTNATEVVVSPDGRKLLAMEQHVRRMTLWDITTAKTLAEWRGDDVGLARGFTADGRHILVVSEAKDGLVVRYHSAN